MGGSGKWVEQAEAKLAWASKADEEREEENGNENTTTDPDDQGGNTDPGGMEP